jgi:hypothetical protein
MKEEELNKEGVSVSAKGPDIVPATEWTAFRFEMSAPEKNIRLEDVTVTGPQRGAFTVENSALPVYFPSQHKVQVVFTST